MIRHESRKFSSFDYLPVHTTEIPGYRMRIRLKAVEHECRSGGLPPKFRTEADGAVFVSGSGPNRVVENVEAHQTLRRSLDAALSSISLVDQNNKRDLCSAMRPDVLDEAFGVNTPSSLAGALSDYQVFATLDHLVDRAVAWFSGMEAVNFGSEKVQVAVGSA